MSLLELPVELLDDITGYIFADDLNHICLACKMLYSVAKQRLPEHRILQQKFRHFNMEKSRYRIGSPIRLLCLLITNLPMGQYFQTIKFGHLRETIWILDYRRNAAELYQNLVDFISKCEGLLDRELIKVSKSFLLAIEDKGDPGRAVEINIFASLLLICLMPNLKEAEMPDIWERLHGEFDENYPEDLYSRREAPQALWDMFDAVPAFMNRTRDTSLKSSGLKTITFGSGYRDAGCEMIDFRLFLEMHALEELQIMSVVEDRTTIHVETPNFSWRPQSPPSSLRILEFKHCFLSLADLAVVLQNTPHLTVLRHSVAAKEYCKFQANGFIRTVSQSIIGPKLKELSLQTSERGNGWGYETIQTLSGLKALEVLEVHCDFLWHGDLAPWITGCDLNEMRQKEHSWISFCPRLVDLIPASVDRLILHSLWLERDSDIFIRYFIDDSGPAGQERKDSKDISVTFCPNMNGTLKPAQSAKSKDRVACYSSLQSIGVNIVPTFMGPVLDDYARSNASEEDDL